MLQLFELCEIGHIGDSKEHEVVDDSDIHDEARAFHSRFPETKVSEYSSKVRPKQRAKVLRRFSRHSPGSKTNMCQVLVCSDGIKRPGHGVGDQCNKR